MGDPLDLYGAAGTASCGLEKTDIFYLGEAQRGGAGLADLEWKQWRWKDTTIGLGNIAISGGIYDPSCDQPVSGASAGMLSSNAVNYEAGAFDEDFVIGMLDPVQPDAFPVWQYTWVLVENPDDGSAKNVIIEYINAKRGLTGGGAWPSYHSEFNTRGFCKILGVCSGVGPSGGAPRDLAAGLLSKSDFPHGGASTFINFPAVTNMGVSGGVGLYQIRWNAYGSVSYEDVYGATLGAPHNPDSNCRYYDSYNIRTNPTYGAGRFVIEPNQTLVALIGFSMDTKGAAADGRPSGSIDRTINLSYHSGWKIVGVSMKVRYFQPPT